MNIRVPWNKGRVLQGFVHFFGDAFLAKTRLSVKSTVVELKSTISGRKSLR